MSRFAVIFDLDGTIVDNHTYHRQAWVEFFRKRDIYFDDAGFKEKIFGNTTRDFLESVFGPVTTNELKSMEEEKEAIYRNLYAPHVTPVKGLKEFLTQLRENGLKLGVATSAPEVNLNFTLSKCNLMDRFDTLTHVDQVSNGKPHPEIYRSTMNKLGVSAEHTLVFEDSMIGVKAGIAAGARVVGIATSISENEFDGVHSVINDYTEVDVKEIKKILEENYEH